MDTSNSDRTLLLHCAAFQSLVAVLLLTAIMGNIPIEKGYALGMVSSLAMLISIGIATLVGSAGGSPTVLKVARVLLWIPLLMLVALFVIGGLNP